MKYNEIIEELLAMPKKSGQTLGRLPRSSFGGGVMVWSLPNGVTEAMCEYCTMPRCANFQPLSWPGQIQSDLIGLCRECAIAKLVRELEAMLAAPPKPEGIVPDDPTLAYLEIVALREWDGRELDAYLAEDDSK